MEKKFVSKALEANLAETRYKDIVIRPEYQLFIDLSKKYYGIHKRANDCVIEYQHPFSNKKFVAEELRKILLTDYWFYIGLKNPEQAFKVPLELLENLLCQQHDVHLNLLIIRTLLEFVQKVNQENKSFDRLITRVCEIMHAGFKGNERAYIEGSKYFEKFLQQIAERDQYRVNVFSLSKKIYHSNIEFWKNSADIEGYLKDKKEVLKTDSKVIINSIGRPYFQLLEKKLEQIVRWKDLVEEMPDFDTLADRFAATVDLFERFTEKFYFIFFLLKMEGMQVHHERLIWKLNKMLVQIMDEIIPGKMTEFIDSIFDYAAELRGEHTSSVLDMFLTVGKKIIDIDQSKEKLLVAYFETELIGFGFETPGAVYVNEEWQLDVNENHIKNIRVWLELIEYSQSVMERLLSALIVNLKLGGIFISDTDLFQRDITKILNSNISPFYKKVKQLTRIFPVYFNEIGAEGDIRKVTTTMDELSHRQDKLIHFLRKQVHTESNNTLIGLAMNIFRFWYDGNLIALKEILPHNVYESIDKKSEWFAPVHRMVIELCRLSGKDPEELIALEEDDFEQLLGQLSETNDRDIERLRDIRSLYAFLEEKYSFETVDITKLLKRYSYIPDTEIDKLDAALSENDFESSLKLIYHFMKQLKDIIFNPKPSQSWENIYHKRHIAIGIPSMYGVYREPKFEALGLTFRLEKVATRLMEKVVEQINLNYISAKTLSNIHTILDYFREGLELDGITNQSFSSNLMMLKYSLRSQSFSFHQYINIFKFIADDVKRTLNKYFFKSYELPLQIIVPQLYNKEEPRKGRKLDELINRHSEAFYRDVLAEAFLMQPLDNFVLRITNSLRKMADELSPSMISEVMSYNSDLIIARLSRVNHNIDNQVFLGSKAYHLKKLRMAHFPVPSGFVITTEVFRRHKAILGHPELRKEMYEKIRQHLHLIEKTAKKEYGNPANPLLLSIRSGTAISMPGAMDTLLNVGMNDQITESLGNMSGYEWSAWDSYRRLLQSWGMAFGLKRDDFDAIMNQFKVNYGIDKKTEFSSKMMREIAFAYKEKLKKEQITFEEDVFKQLLTTINLVFDSWSSKRAIVYRKHLEIADEWGTAVIAQQMIFGNMKQSSGSGVLFTQNPKKQQQGVHLYGDFSLRSQGEDIVAGLVKPHPVSKIQNSNGPEDALSLEEYFPEIYKRLYDIAVELTENLGYSHQEIEFTFESEKPEDLYILQTRDMDMSFFETVDHFETPVDKMNLVGRGIGIGGGALNGRVAIDMEDIERLRKEYLNESIILIRPDTVPDDIAMIFETDALLTAKGGATSHAAVTAVRLGKTSIVSCTGLLVYEKEKRCVLNNQEFKTGDEIAIDGSLGNVYKGHYPIESSTQYSAFKM